MIFGLLSCLLACLLANAQGKASLVVTMICRDEEVNLRSNLEAWARASIGDAFVFLIDHRTTDASREVISSILTAHNVPYTMKNYTFNGFGDARTQSLAMAWDSYQHMSHVLIADPDWVPVGAFNKEQLDTPADVFRFTVYDRNGMTKRAMDWCLRHRQGLSMAYALHEVLSIGYYTHKPIDWVFREVERSSWHKTAGHAHSMSQGRYAFDLQLLYTDLPLHGHDPHIHYYLGITHHAHMEAIFTHNRTVSAVDLAGRW